MSRRDSIRNGLSKEKFAVLNSDGEMVAVDDNRDEAYEKARHAAKKGVVVIDKNVYAKRENPKALPKNAVDIAFKAAEIKAVKKSDWLVDPGTKEGKKAVKEARAVLRESGRELYGYMLEALEDTIHRAKDTKGVIAANFSPAWLTTGLLRQNQKMAKFLEFDESYDSIGLSLLPHGASFRSPFSTSTDHGPKGASYCKFSSHECRNACLVNTGQRALESGSFAASYLFSHLLRKHPAEFLMNLMDQCLKAWEKVWYDTAKKKGHGRFIRLNVLSDIPWEKIAPGFLQTVTRMARENLGVAKDWNMSDGLAFYDYTKIPYRAGVKGHYDLTYSYTGKRDFEDGDMGDHMADILEGQPGVANRMAVVFVQKELKYQKKTQSFYRASPGANILKRSKGRDYMPFTFFGEPVWNGDRSDIRALDPKDVRVVGLAYKVGRYKDVPEPGSGKQYSLTPVVKPSEIDHLLPTFLVRVMQPDPEAPPIVVPTQDKDNRAMAVPGLEIIED